MPTNRVGRLTLAGEVGKDLLKAVCSCGYPLLVAREDWGTASGPLGCSPCHREEVKLRAEEHERELREREMERLEAAKQARLRDTYYLPAYHELNARQRKLFHALAERASFDVGSVARLLSNRHHACDDAEAWEAIQELLAANCLVEHQGPLGEARRYERESAFPYEAGCSKYSTYSIRKLALHQARAVDAREETEQAVEPPTPPRESVTDLIGAQLRDSFLPDRCTVGIDEWDYLIAVRSKYVAYREDAGKKPCDPIEFEDALKRIDGVTINNGKVRGLRLKRAGELEAMTAPTLA